MLQHDENGADGAAPSTNPDGDGGAEDFPEYGFTFTNVDREDLALIPSTWVLLDSQSTVSVFRNACLLTNIRASTNKLKVITNGGTQTSTLVGNVPNFGPVWYNPKSIANILSLAAVRKVCRITMDTAVEAAMIVHKRDGLTMKFKEFSSGLYYYDAAVGSNDNMVNPPVNGYSFVNTVASNKQRFHHREIEGADLARELYQKIGRPSQKHFEHILRNNLIRNCPITVDDAKRALMIYGPDVPALKGKTTKDRSKTQHVPSFHPTLIPAPILKDHSDVTLCVDFFFVQKYAFLHTISRKIKFRTISHVTNRTKPTMLKGVKEALDLYHSRGFTIVDIHADMEFESIRSDIRPTELNVMAMDEHVGEVERSVRTIKERVRSDVHSMPFKRLPKMMIIELVNKALKGLNQFPALDGVSETLSPLTIMMGVPSPDYNNMRIMFGSYAQVFEDNDPTNTNKNRTTGAIALNPTGNAQGGYYFMSLATGRRLSRTQWMELPMPQAVIEAVENRAKAEGQPLIQGGCPLFEWRPNRAFQDGPDEPHEDAEGAVEDSGAINHPVPDEGGGHARALPRDVGVSRS